MFLNKPKNKPKIKVPRFCSGTNKIDVKTSTENGKEGCEEIRNIA
jgi:hypothetical protein